MSISKEDIYNTRYSKPEIFQWYSKKGITATFIYSPNILKNGSLITYDPDDKSLKAIRKNGETYLPECFFKVFEDVCVEKNEKYLSICRADKRVICRLSDDDATSFQNATFLTDQAENKFGHIYLPAIKTALALGIECRAFDDGKLTVFAKKELLDEIELDTELQVSASYAVIGKYDASKFTHQDFENVKNKWRKVLVGSPEINDPSDPDMKEKLKNITSNTQRLWDSMHKEKDRFILFGDTPPTESNDLTVQYSSLWTMTQGFATHGSGLYKNEELKNAILDAMQWMYENMYGEAEIEGRGWRSIKAFNWWDWFFGGIEPMTNILMVMEEYLSAQQIQNYLKCFKYVLTVHRLGYVRPCAMSRLNVCTKAALLLEDREMLENECADYDLVLSVSRMSEGIHVDYLEWTHGYPYNMMYGFNNLSRAAFTGTLLGSTPMEYVTPKQYELYNVAKYMFEAACYKGQGFMIFNGRGNSGSEFSSGVSIMNGVLPLIGLFGEEEDNNIKKLVKRCASTPRLVAMLKNACSVYNFAKLMEILRDDTIPTENDYELAHAWYTGDRFVQHRNDTALLVAMPSSRHPSYESINSANKRGWYTGDGALYLYTDHDRNVFDGANYITNERICYRVAGTTADDRKRTVWSYRKGWHPSKSFSGCLDVDKKYGVAAFDYESYHYEGHEADGTSDGDYGGGFTYYENDLVAKKSYFFFDKECVCLGAGINSTMDANVLTTLEHRRMIKEGQITGCEDVIADGNVMPKSDFDTVISSPKWLWLEGAAGYVLPTEHDVHIERYTLPLSEAKTDIYYTPAHDEEKFINGKPYVEMSIYHGKNPTNAKYQYIILPGASESFTKEYSQDPKITVLSNTEKIQAVCKDSLRLIYIVFHEAGDFDGISTDKPCIMALKFGNGTLSLSVCEPTHKESSVKITLNTLYTLDQAPIDAKIDNENGKTTVTFNTENSTGEPKRATFRL